ncbi:hypothetical protein OG778_26920 [Streptomyces sp. NBC_00184]|uniref:hypothetical protein n=1 Tax=Streptomyces sp. NBC_00184 TaxID=2975673 RepID=UPI002E2A0D79|nr:hypothetical protein [Streptomyces sp. NBC_00184]
MTDQPVFLLGQGLQALEVSGFETEAEFQELLARHPRVLDFGTLADGRPLRLVLVAREMGVATSAESGSAYWLDHLFVDAEGVPTLVEVKRATDTRIRREVVGQMLDYAANGARYWPAALLQHSFEETCKADGRDLAEAYGELLDERSPGDFWALVEERLAAGQMRLLFVADRIPLELRAIVEFLNRQMRHTDVYAVELTQYRGAGELTVLVPRVYGEVATAAKSPSGQQRSAPRTREELEAALERRCTPEVRRVAKALLDHAQERGRLVGGTARYPSMNLHYQASGQWVPVGTLSLYDGAAAGELAFSFGSITKRLGREAVARFADALPPVGELGKKLAVQRESGFNGWPGVSLSALAVDPGIVEHVIQAIEQLVDR